MTSRLRRLLAALGDDTRAFKRPEYRVEDRLATFGVAFTIICGIASLILDNDGQIALAGALILIITIATWVTAKVMRSRQRP